MTKSASHLSSQPHFTKIASVDLASISSADLASVVGGDSVTYGSPTTITSSPWSNQQVNINNYGAGVRPPGMPLYEYRKQNPGFVPPKATPRR